MQEQGAQSKEKIQKKMWKQNSSAHLETKDNKNNINGIISSPNSDLHQHKHAGGGSWCGWCASAEWPVE